MTSVFTPLAQHPVRAVSAAAAALATLATLVSCGGGGSSPPQLSAATPGSYAGNCAELVTRIGTLANTRVVAANTVAAGALRVGGQDVPEHCQVTGKMHERTSTVDGVAYAISFEMRLPRNWNGRFLHQGNGGIDGNVASATGAFGGGAKTHALMQGFAVLSSDAGHVGSQGATFGIDPQARLDYGYQAVQKLTPVAKSMIQATYGKAPDRSYFGGCSNGGRHALVTAARLPTDYDGFLAGAPGFNLPKAAIANIFGGQRYASVATNPADLSTGFTAAERATLAAAVLAKCDALDGATDGLIQDVEACQRTFNFAADVPTCSGARDGTCLSAAQKTAIAPIFSGAVTSTGAPVYSPFPFDAGIGAAGIAFWEFTAPVALDSGAVGLIFKTPPEPANFNGPAWALSTSIDSMVAQISATNATYTESGLSFMTPPNASELSRVKNRGGKILVYHGVSDPIFSVADTVAWYENIRTLNVGDPSDHVRLFRVPGMGHCSGGPATDQFDVLTALVAWVEQGVAPDSISASARGAGNTGGVNAEVPAGWSATRTRPLCPYPKVARFVSGGLDDAASFACR